MCQFTSNCVEGCAQCKPKPIDWTKPVRTTQGHSCRVVCMDRKGLNPIVVLVLGLYSQGEEYSIMTRPDGLVQGISTWKFENDPAPKKKVKVYLFLLAKDLIGNSTSSKVVGPMSEKDAISGGYLNHPSYRVLKTEEFEYEE